MIDAAVYKVNLYLNGNLIGDCRPLAQNLKYIRRRTKIGADEIDFTINDVLFNRWCEDRQTNINNLLKPLALECRLVRNGVEVVGGFLATMPSYTPLNTSANLALRFDGFLNLLAGVYIRNTSTNLPRGFVQGPAGALVSNMIVFADTVARNAGKAYNFVTGYIDSLPNIQHTFDNYKTVKDWICDRCDNATGAGPFDVYFHANKRYDIYSDSNFGDVITDWIAFYPTLLNNTSATSIQAAEVGDIATAVFGLGTGEVSPDATKNTAVNAFVSDVDAIAEYGYKETMYQDSSIATRSVLRRNMQAELWNKANPVWQPQITLHGKQVAPTPSGPKKIWIGDTITVNNSADLTGMTNGDFRVNELEVDISAGGDELIRPVLERV